MKTLPYRSAAKHRKSYLYLLLLILFGMTSCAGQFLIYETKRMRLIYQDQSQYYIIPHMARAFETAWKFHREHFQYEPSENPTVFLHDINDYGTGGANSIPWNYVVIGLEPYDYVYETGPTNERMTWVMNHELFHVLAMDKAAGSDLFYRKIFFGKVGAIADQPVTMLYSYLTNPRWYSPRWYHEGGAVFMETWMSGGIGRSLGGYDEMVFRTMVHDSSYFYDYVGLESEGTTIDFQIGANSYLYGTRFMSYLGLQYGPEKFMEWFNRTEESKSYYSSQFENVYHSSLDDEWKKWIQFEHEWQRTNLDTVRKFPVTKERPILPQALGSVSRAFYDSTSDEFYLGANFPGTLPALVAVKRSNGAVRQLCNISTPALYYVCSLAFDPDGRQLFFTSNNSRLWRNVNVYNLTTGETKMLLKDARIGDLVFNRTDKSLWGVRHHNGISTLVTIPAPYSTPLEVFPLLYGKDIFDLDISPDGNYLTAAMVEINGRQRLIRMELPKLAAGKDSVEELYEFSNNSPENFIHSPDGKYLYGTSYYSGVSNIFRFDLSAKKMDAMTNCETGFFRPMELTGDSLFTFRYTGKGFLPVMVPKEVREDVNAIAYLGQAVVEKYPVLKAWKVDPPSPEKINLDTVKTDSGAYNGLGSINLSSAYPIVEGYKQYTAAGMRANFTDPVGMHNLYLSASILPSSVPADERFHLAGEYQYWQWKLGGTYNGADFYDLFGPTKTSRKGYSAYLQYKDDFINERPLIIDYTIAAAHYGNLERLPDFQNVAAASDQFQTLSAKINYSYLQRTLGGVEPERGVKAGLVLYNYFAHSILFPRLYGMFDYGFGFPLDHSSLWIRAAAGSSLQNRTESFANFYFGGFGNNWIDYKESRRYRDYYAFPGVEINDLGGRNFLKSTVEWVLPPLRFRRFGIPVIYATWTQLSFFSGGLVTNVDDQVVRNTTEDVGTQLDTQFVLFSHLESTLSLGYAFAFQEGQSASKEFMISLKILK